MRRTRDKTREPKMLTGKRNVLIVLTIVTTMAIGGAAAVWANGNSGNVIYACVNDASGTVKIVAADTICSQNSTLVHWNQEGTPGADGAEGPEGPQGESGVPMTPMNVYTDFGITQATGTITTVEVLCRPGDIATGGGFILTDEIHHLTGSSVVLMSVASGGLSPDGWIVTAATAVGDTVEVQVVCITPAD
jgi:hypothetical protein